jgi:hypothetical protein
MRRFNNSWNFADSEQPTVTPVSPVRAISRQSAALPGSGDATSSLQGWFAEIVFWLNPVITVKVWPGVDILSLLSVC